MRERETSRLLTLKSLGTVRGAIRYRPEYKVGLAPDVGPSLVANWPAGPARELVEEAVGEEFLECLFTVRQTRHVCHLLEGERAVAELSLDEVRFETGAPSFELEVELLPAGTESDLERIAGILQSESGLKPVAASKFERGLARKDRSVRALKSKYPDIHPADPMSEAGRKTLRLHFERMLAYEPGTRLGEDIEELHDMRVATRRMRAAFRVFAPHFEPQAIRTHLKGLKRTGRALGPVRDLDVFEEKAGRYLETLPAELAHTLDGLIAAWRRERAEARERMLGYLDHKTYVRFVERFDRFLSTPGAGAQPIPAGKPVPFQVRHVVPRLIYTRYEAVRAYEPLFDAASIDVLHALRIDFKQLRYALEFFIPVLGPEARMVIKEVKVMQDHLGDLNDARVAIQLLREFLSDREEGRPGIVAYLQNREAEKQRLLDTFPAAWERFDRPEVRTNLALSVATL